MGISVQESQFVQRSVNQVSHVVQFVLEFAVLRETRLAAGLFQFCAQGLQIGDRFVCGQFVGLGVVLDQAILAW